MRTLDKKQSVSYELYRELSSEILSPIDDCEMSLELRYELYLSKLTFLYNVQDQCFKAINLYSEKNTFNMDDLYVLQKAIEITKDFITQTVKDKLISSIEKSKNSKIR